MQTPLMMPLSITLWADFMHWLLHVLSALVYAAIFGVPSQVFWPYFCAITITIIGTIVIVRTEWPGAHGIDRLLPFGRVFYCASIAGFGAEHFVFTQAMTEMVPSYLPFHKFFVILCGLGLICGALAIVTKVLDRLASLLVGIELGFFFLLMMLPNIFQEPHNRLMWALVFREGSFSAAMLAYAGYLRRGPSGRAHWLTTYGRYYVGISVVVYGVMQVLFPANVPLVPLERMTPDYIPLHLYTGYLIGVIYVIAGLCVVANFRAREAASALGITALFYMLCVYTPILLATPGSIDNGFNYFFDSFLFTGCLLTLAYSLPKVQAQSAAAANAITKEGHAHA
jgi:uncharacterized membrane protein